MFELCRCGSHTHDLFQRHDKEMTNLDLMSRMLSLVDPAILWQFVSNPMHMD